MKYQKEAAGGPEESQGFVELLAQELETIRDRLNKLTIRGPVFGTIWSTYPEKDEDLFGPLVVILDAGNEAKAHVFVVEASQDLDRREDGDVLMRGNASELHFSCIVRPRRVFLIPKSMLRTCAGELSPDEAITVLSKVSTVAIGLDMQQISIASAHANVQDE